MSNKREVIMVIGSGRSGTSLAMQMLKSWGSSISNDTIPVGDQNTRGAYEDRTIFNATRELYRELGANQYLPLPENWFNTDASRKLVDQLADVLLSQVASATSTYCFKDPKSTLLLPLWKEVFEKTNITSKYILAIRNPVAVCSSFVRHYNRSQYAAELLWLNHNITAITDSGADCFILHYEDWFSRAYDMSLELIEYAGINGTKSESELKNIISSVISSDLNRAQILELEINNRFVNQLYETLAECRGNTFDTKRLLLTVASCKQAMSEFMGWPISTYNIIEQQASRESKKLKNQISEKHELKAELKTIVNRSNQYLIEIKDLRDKFNKEIRNMKKIQLKEMDRFVSIEESFSYQFGRLVVLAISKPGKNTLLLPGRMLKLLLK